MREHSFGAAVSDVADVDNRWGVPPPVVNVVEVPVRFHPVPEPVASPTSIACAEFSVWSSPLSVVEKLTLGGAETKPRDPAEIITVR